MTIINEGGCQCGEIRYRFDCEPVVVYVCHCTDCQKQSSSAFGISVWVPAQEFRLIHGELKFLVTQADSGNTKRCAFCPDCGSRIYHLAQDQPHVLSVKGGTLDQARMIRPVGHIWTSSGHSWAVPSGSDILQFSREPKNFDELIDLYVREYAGEKNQRP
jgi:hypothetical protein